MKLKIVIIVLLLATVGGICIKQQIELNGYRERIEQQEYEAKIEESLSGLRIPYELILWDSKHFRSVSESRYARCKALGIEAVSSYNAVRNDRVNQWSINHYGDCWNASFELYWLGQYCDTVHNLIYELEHGKNPVGKAMIEKDEKVLGFIRLHIGRALKSKEPRISSRGCKLWLALFEANEDVIQRLQEMVVLPKDTYSRNNEKSYKDYSRFTIEAVMLIDNYGLDVEYDEQIKLGQEYIEEAAK